MAIGLNVTNSSHQSHGLLLCRLSGVMVRNAMLLPVAPPSRLVRSGDRAQRVVAGTEAERNKYWATVSSTAAKWILG